MNTDEVGSWVEKHPDLTLLAIATVAAIFIGLIWAGFNGFQSPPSPTPGQRCDAQWADKRDQLMVNSGQDEETVRQAFISDCLYNHRY